MLLLWSRWSRFSTTKSPCFSPFLNYIPWEEVATCIPHRILPDNRRTQLPFLPRFFTSSAHAEIAADPPHVPAWLLQLWPPAAPSGAPGLPAHGSGGEVVSGHRGGICDSGVTWSPLQFRTETPAVPHCFHLRPHVPANHARDRVPTYAHVLLPIRYTRMRTYAYIPVGTRA